jgi:hypothetical protein
MDVIVLEQKSLPRVGGEQAVAHGTAAERGIVSSE